MVQLTREHGRTTFRAGGASGVVRPRMLAVGLVLLVVVLVPFCYGMTIGSFPISFGGVVRALFGAGEPGAVYIVQELRLPRALAGLLAGLAFGMAGAIFQTVTRNPLASPDIVGVNAGAAALVVAGITFDFGSGTWLGVAGGIGAGLVVYVLSWRRGTTGYRFILVGVGVAAMCTSITDFLMTKAQVFEAQRAMGWLVGSLNDREWSQVQPLMVALVVCTPVAVVLGPWLRQLQLGDEVAVGLGTPVRFAHLTLLVTGVCLATFATAAAGPVLFVALVSPQIAQRLTGMAWPPMIVSGLTGSAVILTADVLTRHILPSAQLPVGVVTGALGAPVLLWLLTRR
ncbi:FecCD family ABC transporter permease [Actinophytocola oryzae]|uniref:Iron complex transport system permease protein n=1 Tax=Actinophytocola oryzae TaxID=502181 RepID=A0A4R7UZ67_9PSEU|nr:iron chelate uptake ABC transporter family permease subunit [Actinophytocola oryzae]TDV42228.1 iron complex transport system permease protein [Actinophytocola oryzae]